jgi:DNA-binding ferritin-like protein
MSQASQLRPAQLRPEPLPEPHAEADFLDRIAELLPVEQRPLWYREMAHLRRLPAEDEMLRIAYAMGFLALITRQTPAEMANEREQITAILNHSVADFQSTQQAVTDLHNQLEERLEHLPKEIIEGISPTVIAGKINESLRQQFLATGMPETSQALAIAAKQTRQTAAEFSSAARELTSSYQSVVKDANNAIREIRSSINHASEAAANAAATLNRNFHRDYKWSVYTLCAIALSLGFILGDLFQWWVRAPMTRNTAAIPIVQTAPAPLSATPNPTQSKPKHQNRTHALTPVTLPSEPQQEQP